MDQGYIIGWIVCWAVFAAALSLRRVPLAILTGLVIAAALMRAPAVTVANTMLAVFIAGSLVYGLIARLLQATQPAGARRKAVSFCAWFLIFMIAAPAVLLAADRAMKPGGRLASMADAGHSCRQQPSKVPSCSAQPAPPAPRAAPP